MFSPEGYISLARLWDSYRKERLANFYVRTAQTYANRELDPQSPRGSPLDICEHIFLKSITMCGLHIAAPDQRIMSLHTTLTDDHPSACSVLPVSTSAWRWAAHKLDVEASDAEPYFSPQFVPWHGTDNDMEFWTEAYPEMSLKELASESNRLEKLRYHCLPLCFERPSFTIAKKRPPWSFDLKHSGDIDVILDSFAGWSLCMSLKNAASWQPYLKGRGVYPDEVSFSTSQNAVGRPQKQEEALQDYKRTFPDGHPGSLRSAVDVIWATTKNRYSVSTLSRALTTDKEK